MKQRTRLIIRQSLAYREGKSQDANWHVGYWDRTKPVLPSDDAFRSFGSRPTVDEAIEFAKFLANKNKEFFFED